MTQIETIMKIATILKGLPDTVLPDGSVEWREMPNTTPFVLPLGKPLQYMRVGNTTKYRKPSEPVVMTPSQVRAILAGEVLEFDGGEVMDVFSLLDYLGFTSRKKLAEVILKEYELELELNDFMTADGRGNSWLPGAVHEGKTVVLELLLGYDGYCGFGVSVSWVNTAWEAYMAECDANDEPVDWNHKVKPHYVLYVQAATGDKGMEKLPRETTPQFLERIG